MSPDLSSAELGPELWSFLLRCLLWALGAALVVAGIVWATTSGDRAALTRARRIWFGDRQQPEPRARRFLRVSFGLLWIIAGLLQAQPRMPAGFMGAVLAQTASGPAWLADLVGPLARAWTRHPVVADAATVSVQVGLGLLLILGGRGLLARLAAWAAIGWSLVVWVLGEGVGGLFDRGATWWSGAPGAVLVYLAAAVLLLLPEPWWRSGRAQLVVRRVGALWLAVAAVLQVLPAEGGWTAAGASGPFAAGAGQTQPRVLAWPIEQLTAVAARHPQAVNGTTVVLVAGIAVLVWLSGRTAVLVTALILCGATWWLAQDFGVLGGLATDPNTALPLGLLFASALPALRGPGAEASTAPAATAPAATADARRLGLAVGAGLSSLAVVLALVVPVVLAGRLPAPADAAALAADSGGGLRAIPPRAAPSFDLVDQDGRAVSTSSARGKLLLVTFLDPVCSADCPLIADQLGLADRQLGGLADRVEIVAIDTNPVFSQVTDVAAFTQSHALDALSNWHFVTGPADRVQDVLAEFGIAVAVPTVGMIEHSEGVYFITPDGREAAYLGDGAGDQLTTAYSAQIRDEIRDLL